MPVRGRATCPSSETRQVPPGVTGVGTNGGDRCASESVCIEGPHLYSASLAPLPLLFSLVRDRKHPNSCHRPMPPRGHQGGPLPLPPSSVTSPLSSVRSGFFPPLIIHNSVRTYFGTLLQRSSFSPSSRPTSALVAAKLLQRAVGTCSSGARPFGFSAHLTWLLSHHFTETAPVKVSSDSLPTPSRPSLTSLCLVGHSLLLEPIISLGFAWFSFLSLASSFLVLFGDNFTQLQTLEDLKALSSAPSSPLAPFPYILHHVLILS